MVEGGASGRFDKILIEGRDSISREDLLKYIKSNFERLILKNIESLQRIISLVQEEILGIAEDNTYLVYRNYKTHVGEVRENPFKTRARNSKRFRVAESVESGRQCQKQEKNPSKEGGRYYPCHREVKNHYIFSKVRFQFCEKDETQPE